jgi:hypothetical protein
LAITYTRHLGVSPDWYPASAVTGGRYPPLEWHMSQFLSVALAIGRFLWRTVTWGTQWGQLDDAQGPIVAFARVFLGGRGVCLIGYTSFHITTLTLP